MPFKSKRQMRAAFAGVLPGFSEEKAHEWAHETPALKSLPDRAPAEKGKPTLRSKSSIDHLAHDHDTGKGLEPSELRKGKKVEMEHTHDPATARQIAIDHVRERPDYYEKLDEMEHSPLDTSVVARLKREGYPVHEEKRSSTSTKLLYIIDHLENVNPSLAKAVLDVHNQESRARSKVSMLRKVALALPGPGEVRKITSSSVGRFRGIAGATPAALRAPGPANPNLLDPSRSIPNAMKAFK